MQAAPPRNVPLGSRASQLSEDCLTLNIWAPASGTNEPVMVWLHGGGNVAGSSADKYFDGTAFARDGIVLVSLNYRLGVLGFAAFDGEANFGLWDQVAALHWVQENIAAFGGNPQNVTVFGESAGGEDVIALLTAAPARALFQKAIAESAGGGWGPPPSLSSAEDTRAFLAKHVNGQPAQPSSDPRALTAEAVLEREAEHGDWGPVIDGHLLTEPPLRAIEAGHAARIPLIIGTNNEEGSLLGLEPRPDSVFSQLTSDDLAKLKTFYGTEASTEPMLARLIFRDGYFAGPARWIAAQLARHSDSVYAYRFDYVATLLRARREGAFHGSEIPFVFERSVGPLPPAEEDRRVARALHDCWGAFARTSKPTCEEAPGWTTFDGAHWMVIDSHPAMRPIQDSAALDLLRARLTSG
jgi:para-nitrobenzyl esterase